MSRPVRRLVHGLTTTLLALCAALAPAAAQDIKVGIGYGLAFLPIYVCEDLRLVEKHGKEAHLDVKATYQRFVSAAALREAIAAGTIDIGPFGTAPLLIAWEQAKDTPSQIFAVSGLTSLPLVLLSNQPNVQSLGDLKPEDRIAVPTLSSPQKYLLEIQSEKKMFGWFNYDQVDKQLVAMSHAEAISALVDSSGQSTEHVTAYFSSPPFTQIALRDGNIHPILSSSDVTDGKFSFLIMGATKAYIDSQPQMPEIFDKAIDEAARIIHDDPRRAAQIYLTHEPSGTLNGAVMESVIREIRDEFGSAVYGVQSVADFLGRHGQLKSPPKSWKDVVAPALANSPSS
jgi:NitT/TauT family transport system substrate-binding protein